VLSREEKRQSLKLLLLSNPKYIDILKKAIEIEEKVQDKEHYLGWEWHEVQGSPALLRRLVELGVLKITYKSRSTTCYMIEDRELVKEVINEIESEREAVETGAEEVQETEEIPKDLFDFIVGYDDVKELFLDAIRSSEPVHILLIGPPASAKSTFLMELSRLPRSYYTIGGSTSKAGLADILFSYSPKYLIIDEMDDMPADEQSILKSLMWEGRVVVTKHNKKLRGEFKTWVFGACNNPNRIADAIKSRFLEITFQPYTEDQFREVVISVLTRRENIDKSLAEYIANSIGKYTRDPRKAISIARLVKNMDIDEAKKKIDRYVKMMWEKNIW